MTDRELLELAAKAAGMTDWRWWEGTEAMCHYNEKSLCWYAERYGGKIEWNPLTDDGDALRLAVKLRLSFESNWALGSVDSWYIGGISHTMLNNPQVDPYAATRRAIVRAAAEIGAGMRPFPTAEEIRSDWLGLSEDDDGVLMK